MSIVDVAVEEAERRCLSRIFAVHLKLGPLSGVTKEALVSAYGLAREGTPLDEAELVVEDTPIVMFCPTCSDRRSVVSPQELRCSTCGSPGVEILSGRELEITALEVSQ